MKRLILASLLSLVSAQAFATSFGCSISYPTRFHFDRVAFGKEVVAVYAHTASLQRASTSRGGQKTWENVQHVQLSASGTNGAFVGYAAITGSDSYENSYSEGAVVQYWVYFADGTELKTDSSMIRVSRSQSVHNSAELSKATSDAFEQLNHEPNIGTVTNKISYCWVS